MSNSILVIFLSILISCATKDDTNKEAEITLAIRDSSQMDYNFDTTFALFGDTSYKLNYHVYKLLDEESPNAILTYTKSHRTIFTDSLYSMHHEIEMFDMNNDKVKDILIFHYTGGRSNPTYYLYLVDSKRQHLTHIKGFEQLPNPLHDSVNNIIISISLSGTNYYRFYRINSNNKLVNLGHSFEDDLSDTTKYENAIKAIRRENRNIY